MYLRLTCLTYAEGREWTGMEVRIRTLVLFEVVENLYYTK